MMDLLPRFSFPVFLLLLALVPWSIYIGARIRSLAAGRKWTAISLRTIILICVIGAIAGAEIVKTSDQLAVFFLLDQSNSIPDEQRRAAAQWVRNATDAYMSSNITEDRLGVIAFGDDASIELNVGAKARLEEVRSYIDGDGTDMAGAIRLAMAAFPQGFMRRIVILSDGNETEGSVLDEAKMAQAAGVEVNTVPLHIESGAEVRMREVGAPGQTSADEPFQLRIVVYSDQDAPATLQIYQRVGKDRRMLQPQDVQLEKGDNVFLLTQELTAPGFYEYEVNIDSPADTVRANNVGRAFTTVHGEPTLLFVEGTPENALQIVPALQEEGLNVDQMSPMELPSSLAQFQTYDAVVLSDVSAMDLTGEQLNMLEAMVRDQGIGLVVLGGPNTFGAGGLQDSPLERALPVSMDLKQRKILPSSALVLVIDKSGSMEGEKVQMAKRAAIASVQLLSSKDYLGIVAFDSSAYWVVDVQLAADKRGIAQAIGTLGAGGGTDMYPALEEAYHALLQTPANLRHCIVLSDGQSQPGNAARIVRQMAAENITVSTVALGQGADQDLLSDIAKWGGGRYYFTDKPNDIPQFFAKEALVVRKNMLIEEEFTPVRMHESEVLSGIAAGALPPLHGYVMTTAKDAGTMALVSHEDDPILAHWRYGLGKSVAFTSDTTNRWAQEWLEWGGFNRFWAQTMRWAMRTVTPSNFQISKSVRDGMGHLRIDAVDEQGKFVNFLRPRAVVTSPDFDQINVDLEQTGPGIYEANFPVDDTGVYVANIAYDTPGGETQSLTTGLSLDYSREYEYNSSNLPLLEHVAAVGGGRVMTAADNPFEHNLVASATVTPLWPYLLAIAACLLPLEIFVRRVMLPYSAMLSGVQAALRRAPGLGRLLPQPTRRGRPATGAYRAATQAQGHDFGEASEPAAFGQSPPPARPGLPPDAAAEMPSSAAASGYTQQLLAAKERAIQGKKSRLSTRTDEENESHGKR